MLYQTENPHGGEVYSHPVELDFSANINPLGTPEAVREAVRGCVTLLSQYPDPYCRELAEAIARYEGVDKERVLCGNGAAELIFALCAALRPRKALLPVPSFSEYRAALDAVGCRTELYYLKEADGFALTEAFLPALEAFSGELLLLCNPSNPTGRLIAPALLEQILEICEKKGIFLFLDECFLDFVRDGDALSLKSRLKASGNFLLLKAFTKSYGMAGLRLGYCLCGNETLLKRMGLSGQAWNVSLPAQRAGVAALGQRDFLNRAREIVWSQRPKMAAAMERMGLTVIPSQANFLLFRASTELYAPLLERGIQIRRCANYPGLSQGWYRVAVKLPEQNRRLLAAMEEICNG